jgi:spore coat protein U-like protein
MSKSFVFTSVNHAVRASVIAALAGMSLIAGAATDTADLTVTATVANQCSVGNAALSLGAITLVGADGTMATPTGSSTIGVPWACTNGTSATLGFGNGNNFASSTRRMSSGTVDTFLEYELRSGSSAGTVIASTALDLSGADGTDKTLTVWGGPVNSTANKAAKPASDYTDTVLMTITFTP